MNERKSEMLTVDIKFKLMDILRYNLSVMLKSTINKVMLLAGLFLSGLYFYKMIHREVALDLFFAHNIVLLLVPVMIFLLIPWRVWKITLTQMQVPAFAFGVIYTFSVDKIILDVGEAQEEMSWDTFIKIMETQKDFRFFVDPIRAQLIPKHNLTKEEIRLIKTIAEKAAKKGTCHFKMNA